jgi:hypothetical protein
MVSVEFAYVNVYWHTATTRHKVHVVECIAVACDLSQGLHVI